MDADEDVVMEDVVDIEDEHELLRIADEVSLVRSHTGGGSSTSSARHGDAAIAPAGVSNGSSARGRKLDTIAVVDTNFAVSHLNLLQEFATSARAKKASFAVVVPWRVLTELDGLKSRDNDVGVRARRATRWILAALEADQIRGQRKDEVVESADARLKGDDAILDCCRYFLERQHCNCALLSNDTNLCAKARVHGIPSVKPRTGLTAAEMVSMFVGDGSNGNGHQNAQSNHTGTRTSPVTRADSWPIEVASPIVPASDSAPPSPTVARPRPRRQPTFEEEMQTDAVVAPYGTADSFKLLDDYAKRHSRPRRTSDQVLDSFFQAVRSTFPRLVHAALLRDYDGDAETVGYLFGEPRIDSVDDVVRLLGTHSSNLADLCAQAKIGIAGIPVRPSSYTAALAALRMLTQSRGQPVDIVRDWSSLWCALSAQEPRKYRQKRDTFIDNSLFDLQRRSPSPSAQTMAPMMTTTTSST